MTTATEPRTADATASPQTVTTTIGSLAQALRAVIPFAGRDCTLPAMELVHLHCGDGTLTATASDRYVIGHARVDATGALRRPRYLHWSDARALRRDLTRRIDERQNSSELVTLAECGPNLSVTYGGTTITFTPPLGADNPPNLAPILNALVTADTVGVLQPIGFNPRVIRPLLKVADLDRLQPLRWFLAEPDQPSRVEIGDWFVGAIMPVRLRGDEKNIPVDLPGSPVEAEVTR